MMYLQARIKVTPKEKAEQPPRRGHCLASARKAHLEDFHLVPNSS